VLYNSPITDCLFIRHFRRPTGGNVTVRDFFFHASEHSALSTRIWFTPDSRHRESGLWDRLDPAQIAAAPEWHTSGLAVVNGKDWNLIPGDTCRTVIHLVQHLGYPGDPLLRSFLGRRAYRICVSPEVLASVRPFADGPLYLIPNAIDDTLFQPQPARPPGSVLIAGAKEPGLAQTIARCFPNATLLLEWLPQEEFAHMARSHDIAVTLPGREEGFFRPALEAMACGCAVVCSDCSGNRAHCIDTITCLQPSWGDAAAHVEAIRRLLADSALRVRLQAEALEMAARHSLAAQRARFHAVLDEILSGAPFRL
jgi:hypothetical protein